MTHPTTPLRRGRSILTRLGLAFAILFALIAAPTTALASTAHPSLAPRPAVVSGCHLAVCIDVWTGGKNYSNHTQWVDAIDVTPLAYATKLEAWADGYYGASNSTQTVRFSIRRWVRSGTYVCGAATLSGVSGRRIACIYISV